MEAQQPLKYLGVVLDRSLTFLPHVKEVRRKAFIINRIITHTHLPSVHKNNFAIICYTSLECRGGDICIKMIEAVKIWCMSIIVGLNKREISNERINIIPFRNVMEEINKKFFNKRYVQNFEVTKTIGEINRHMATFIIRYRLINHTLG